MSFAGFRALVDGGGPPAGRSAPLQAPWPDARGGWPQAHDCGQADPGRDGCGVHAYLHRKEGDGANAGYWYARAGRSRPATDLAGEWEQIARSLLARGSATVRSAG